MADNYVYGDYLTGYAKAEPSLGSVVAVPAATDAFRARQLRFTPVYDRNDPGDRKNGFSAFERVEGRRRATWSATVLFRPNGTAGQAPDIDDLLKLVFGQSAVTGAVTYSQLADRSALSATIWNYMTKICEHVRGAICESLRIKFSGGDFIILEFSGKAMEYGLTAPTTTAAIGTSTTAMTVADADFLSNYSIVQVAGAGGGKIITSCNYTSDIMTLMTAASWANAAAVDPYMPAGTYTGSPVYGTKGSVTIGGTTFKILEGEIIINTGLDLNEKEYGSALASEVIVKGRWEVKANLTLGLKKTEANLLCHARRQLVKLVVINLGDTAGSMGIVTMPYCEIDPSPLSIPDSGMATVQLPLVAHGSSGEDNITLAI